MAFYERGRKLASITREQLDNLYWQKEFSSNQMAPILNISPRDVRYLLAVYNIPRRDRSIAVKLAFRDGKRQASFKNLDIELIRRLYTQEYLSIEAIADRLQSSRYGISKL